MTLRPPAPISARQDFRDAADAFVALVARIPDDAWERPGLGVWTTRELVGHTARALSTVVDYLAPPAGAPAAPATPATVTVTATKTVTVTDTEEAGLIDAVTYFRRGTRAGLTNSDEVAERGRAAGRDLGPRPVTAVEGLVEQVLLLVDTTADDVVLTSRLGALRLIDYLPTRTFELVVHGLDLRAALGLPAGAPPGPLASALGIATGLALGQGAGPALLLALTGRTPLPADTCVL